MNDFKSSRELGGGASSQTAPLPLAENLWLLAYPLKMLGADLRRNVTLICLRSGKLVIHSTVAFTPEDVAAICALGEPGWLLDGILRHDTFAKEGRAAFPGIPYLAPAGFSDVVGFSTELIVPAPVEWEGELLALEIQGAPEARDTALLHIPSRTLILTELVFNFGSDEPLVRGLCSTPQGLLPGGFAEVTLTLDGLANGFMVPSQAIVPSPRGQGIYLIEDGKAKLQPVEIGIRTDAQVQILRGLNQGDVVATTNLLRIRPGLEVIAGKK